MKKSLLISTFIILLISSSFSQGTVTFTKWKNDATAAYSLNLDDFATQYFGDLNTIADTYDSTGLRISFATIANWSACSSSCQQNYWNWANGRLKGNEFVSHSWTHPDMSGLTSSMFAQEADSSRVFINKMIQNNDCRFFIFPNNTSGEPGFVDYFRNTEYIGCGGGNGDINAFNLTDPYMVKRSYYNGGGLTQLNTTVQLALLNGDWGFRAAHNIGTGGWEPIPKQVFIDHMNYCKQKVDDGSLWMAPVMEVLKYILERENYTLNIISENDTMMEVAWNTSIEINASSKIDNSLFDEYLTIKVTNKFGKILIIDADPYGGNIIIRYNSIDFTEVTQNQFKLYPLADISLDMDATNVDYRSGTFDIIVHSSDGWAISSDANWLSFSTNSGITSDTIVSVMYTENSETSEKSAQVKVSYNNIEKSVLVSQAAAPTLFLSSNEFNFNKNGGNESFIVLSNGTWTASSNQSWLSLELTVGTGNQTVYFSVEENTSSVERNAIITIASDKKISQIISINQSNTSATAINENSAYEFVLFPNPAINYINVIGDFAINSKLSIYSIHGSQFINTYIINNNQQIDISNLPPGMYSLSIESESKVLVSKFVKF